MMSHEYEETLVTRLIKLKAEQALGQGKITESQLALGKLQAMLLRIEGAITVVESLLSEVAQPTGESHAAGE